MPTPRRAGRSLGQAVATGAGLAALAAAAIALGSDAFFALVCITVALALLELLNARRSAGNRPVVAFGLACALVLMFASYRDWPAGVLGAGGAAALGSLVLALRPGRGPEPVGDAAWTVLGVAWIGGGGAAAAAILRLPQGLALTAAYVVVVAADDIAAYGFGSRWGRHKLAPSISPGKSWEGLAAGGAAALVTGAALGGVVSGLGWVLGAGLGVVCAIAAPIGDLIESMVKRELGIKDSGHLLPGHGGFLDRIDAIVLCAPAALVYFGIVLS